MTAHPVPGNADHWWLASTRRLHAVPGAAVTWDQIEAGIDRGEGVRCLTVCGLVLPLRYGGIGARYGATRCVPCCSRLALPLGCGTPVNEAAQQEGQR